MRTEQTTVGIRLDIPGDLHRELRLAAVKSGLTLKAIIEQFGAHVFALPMRIIVKPPSSKEDFQLRLEMLFEATLDACLEQRDVLMVVLKEQANPPALTEYKECFADFLEQGDVCRQVFGHHSYHAAESVPQGSVGRVGGTGQAQVHGPRALSACRFVVGHDPDSLA